MQLAIFSLLLNNFLVYSLPLIGGCCVGRRFYVQVFGGENFSSGDSDASSTHQHTSFKDTAMKHIILFDTHALIGHCCTAFFISMTFLMVSQRHPLRLGAFQTAQQSNISRGFWASTLSGYWIIKAFLKKRTWLSLLPIQRHHRQNVHALIQRRLCIQTSIFPFCHGQTLHGQHAAWSLQHLPNYNHNLGHQLIQHEL